MEGRFTCRADLKIFRIGIGWRSGTSCSAGQRNLGFGRVPWLDLAELIEQLPEEEIQAAVRYLENLKDRGDPYLKFLMSVPEEDERGGPLFPYHIVSECLTCWTCPIGLPTRDVITRIC